MMQYPFVSIVVPFFNESVYLEQCLNALLIQTYPSHCYELVLVDDGSVDSSPDICQKVLTTRQGQQPHMRYVRIKHAGLSVGRNVGIGQSQGELIVYIDGDAIARADWLEKLVAGFAAPDIGVVGGKVLVLNSEEKFAGFIYDLHYVPQLGEDGIIGTNMAYRRAVFEQVGGFFSAFWQRGDEVAFLRKVMGRWKTAVSSQAIVYHEHPPTPMKWLRERFYNGKYTHWLEQIPTTQLTSRQLAGFTRLAIWSFIPAGLAAFRSPFYAVWGVGMAGLFTFRFIRRRYLRGVRAIFYKNGLIGAIAAIGLTWLGLFFEDIGYLREWALKRPFVASDSISETDKYVQKVLTNE